MAVTARWLLVALLCTALCPVVYGQSPVSGDSELTSVPAEFALCDGPSWNGTSLFVPDVKGSTLYEWTPEGAVLGIVMQDVRISGTCYRQGRLYCADNGNARIAVLNGKDLITLAVLDDSDKPTNRPNDLVVDEQGGVYVTMTKSDQVLYVNADGAVSVAVDGIASPNGITLSPDEKTLYVAAYRPKEVWSYDVVKPGVTAAGRILAKMDDGEALGADGMTIDSAGNVYCAGATAVWIWNSHGKLLSKIETPTRPINCAFGGNDLQTLYITCFGGLMTQRMSVVGYAPSAE